MYILYLKIRNFLYKLFHKPKVFDDPLQEQIYEIERKVLRDQFMHFWKNKRYFVDDSQIIHVVPLEGTDARCPENFLGFDNIELMLRDASGKLWKQPDVFFMPDMLGGVAIYIATKKLAGPYFQIIEPFTADDIDITWQKKSEFLNTSPKFSSEFQEYFLGVFVPPKMKNND